MKVCKNCGYEGDSQYCPDCGKLMYESSMDDTENLESDAIGSEVEKEQDTLEVELMETKDIEESRKENDSIFEESEITVEKQDDDEQSNNDIKKDSDENPNSNSKELLAIQESSDKEEQSEKTGEIPNKGINVKKNKIIVFLVAIAILIVALGLLVFNSINNGNEETNNLFDENGYVLVR